MPVVYNADNNEFAGAAGSNVGSTQNSSTLDNPPSNSVDLTVTSHTGDSHPGLFELGETHDVQWNGQGGSLIQNAVVVRSDQAPGGGGIVVLEGVDENGSPAQSTGNRRPLIVSQQHRVLLTHPLLDLHFGHTSMLAPARAFYRHRGNARAPRPVARYVHLAFDCHDAVKAEGIWCESLFAGQPIPVSSPPIRRAPNRPCCITTRHLFRH